MIVKLYFHKQEFCPSIIMKKEMSKRINKGQDSDF